MIFLPIVGRELVTRARSRHTYWGRSAAGAAALIVLGAMMIVTTVSKGMMLKPGYEQFQVLKWMVFIVACSTGVFLTADALSEEKREGTLGLLFLTDLRGYDIVFGKLAAYSVQASYALLAVFPVLAISLLSGGVSGLQFWRAVLIVCNTLLLSLSAGLWVSSFSRDASRATTGTLLLLILILGGLPLADCALADWDATKFTPCLSLGSPAYLLSTTGLLWSSKQWLEIGIQFGTALVFLTLANICVARAWHEKASMSGVAKRSRLRVWRFGSPRRRNARREKLLAFNPVLWLATRDRWLLRLAGVATAAGLGLAIICAFQELQIAPNTWAELTEVTMLSQLVICLMLFYCVSSQAARFFVDALQNGAMELMLVTPFDPKRIVRGQWLALWRTFRLPALFLVAMHTIRQIALDMAMRRNFASLNVKLPPSMTRHIPLQGEEIASLLGGLSEIFSTLLALAWFGMWMGLTTRKLSTAMARIFCVVVVLPWLAIGFILISLETLWQTYRAGAALPSGLDETFAASLNLGVNLFFIFWARHRLMTRFRQVAAREPKLKPSRPAPALPNARDIAAVPNVAGGA